jgi:hypothetical protein
MDKYQRSSFGLDPDLILASVIGTAMDPAMIMRQLEFSRIQRASVTLGNHDSRPNLDERILSVVFGSREEQETCIFRGASFCREWKSIATRLMPGNRRQQICAALLAWASVRSRGIGFFSMELQVCTGTPNIRSYSFRKVHDSLTESTKN